MNNTLTDKILLFLKGMAMGAADVVPGVSGGTIAFITGIYETLLDSIKSITPQLFTVWKEKGFKTVWKKVNGTFLLILFAGIFTSILSLAKLIEYLLHQHPVLIWAFFFGLIVASAIYIARQLKGWSVGSIVILVVGIILAYCITILTPTQAPSNLIFVFLAGCIAICAMILPGISGSFLLLIMGMYGTILGAVNDRELSTLVVFGLGCITGLLSFSHVLSWLFKNYRNLTLAFLTGLMIGSLNKVWPWKLTTSYRTNSSGEKEPFLQENLLPTNFLEATGQDPQLLMAIGMMLIGIVLVLGLERLGKREAV